MRNIVLKKTHDLKAKDIVAADIYSDGRKIIAKDMLLTDRLISSLKNRRIESVSVLGDEKIEVNTTENQTIQHTEDFNELFFGSLKLVGRESRYGNLLSKSEDIDFIMNAFQDILSNNMIVDELYKLRNWDLDTFIHSFDVFIVGSLLAKHKRVPNLKDVSLGYLLHDIGKLNIPKKLLLLTRKLSNKEYETMKAHTTKGELLLKTLGLDHIGQYAKSHHGKSNSIGFPKQLHEEELDMELKILQIVDVYSALTLNRPYRKSLSPSKALEILFRDAHHNDKRLLKEFVELLKIYPSNSTVLLSDNSYAKVMQENEALPMFPIVTRSDDSELFHIPYDFNIQIDKMIEYKAESFQDRFKAFSNNLIVGSSEALVSDFVDLTDGLKIEEIYAEIIIPIYKVITVLHKGGVIDESEYKLRVASIVELLQSVEMGILENNQYNDQILVVTENCAESPVHMKILLGLLHIENIYPVVIKNPEPDAMEYIEKALADFNIKNVVIFHSTEIAKVQKVDLLPSLKFRTVHIGRLEKFIDSKGFLTNQSSPISSWLMAESD